MPVLWLSEVAESDRARVGAKAFTLARLRRAGLPVPDGFVLEIGSEVLDGARSEALLVAYRRLGGAVAVRSSSTAEDLADASFAGQYRTRLDVSGEAAVVEAAASCLQSARAGTIYARSLGAPLAGSMAVLVQRFVEPRAAGVVFTRHPGDPRGLLIEAHAGRGEELVSGRVTPDRYVLDRESGALREGPRGASLDPASLAEVAALARRVEELLGAPQDVEWAIGSDGAVLLQARPITVEPEEVLDPRIRRLTRANVGEVLPDPVTPLTWTTLVAYLEHGFHEVARSTGLLPPGETGRFLVLHHRRLYLNLSLAVEVGMRLPGISTAHAEQLVLGGGAIPREPTHPPARAFRSLAGVAVGLLRLAARLPGEIEAAAEAVGRLPGSGEIEGCEAARLAALLRRFAETGQRLATTHIATSGASAFHLALLGRILAILAPGDAVARVNRLVAAVGDVVSASPALALEAMAEEARQRAEWSAWLASPPEAAAAAFARGEAPAELADRLRAFLERFGHRGLSEGELRASTWEDDPTPVLDSLRTLLGAARSAGLGRRAAVETRHADEEALLARLGPLRRTLLRAALGRTRAWVRRREETKSLAVALVHHGRRLARAAARGLVSTGVLAREDDAYFLTFDELVAALEGARAPSAAVARRRRRHEREAALAAPRDVDFAAGTSAVGAGDGQLAGIGVSAGVGAGPARVLEAGVTPRLEPGEVLVAPVLDAALGPLLASASAAVAEIGGMLSHGSVVARELGVPCVVDVRDATRRIRTGERVTVDGGSGRVRLEASPEAAAGSEAGAPAILRPADPADEAFHRLGDHPLARESVYFNAHDPDAGIALVGSLGVRPGGAGESLLALGLPDGRVLFGLDLKPTRATGSGVGVGPASVFWNPTRTAFEGALSVHEPEGFPPPPLPLVLAPRTSRVSLDLSLIPMTPPVDFCDGLPEPVLETLEPLGRHHVEQSGRWRGTIHLEGRALRFEGTGSRDHSWGIRDWEAADHWRLFTVTLGEDLAVHALAVGAQGRMVEGGFLWRDGRAERITRVLYAGEREEGRLRSLELEVSTAAGAPLILRGAVVRTIAVPVQAERRLGRHLAGRPYRLVLHENYMRYECAGRVGLGMAELTQRPL